MKKNILVILGYPDKDSFCGTLAETYIESAKTTDAEVRELQLGELKFDPVLGKGTTKFKNSNLILLKLRN